MTGHFHRLKYIDALRGIAILLVIVHHSHPYFAGVNNYSIPQWFDTLLQNGDKGVTLFFLMSAFTLCLSYHHKQQAESTPLRNYFIRRVFRIVPMYLFTIALVLILKINNPSASSIVANVFFLHGLSPLWVNSTVPGGWSVGVEVLFYLAFPFLFFRIRSLPAAIGTTLFFMVVAKIFTAWMVRHQLISDGVLWGVFTYENLISQLPVFLLGMCLFHLQFTPLDGRNKSFLNWSLYAVCGLILIHLLGGNVFKLHYLFAIAFAMAAYALSKVPVKLLVNAAAVWIGKISYSLYLIHLVVANMLAKYHFNLYSPNIFMDVALRFCIILLISAPLAYVTYRLIELPLQKFGRRIISRTEHGTQESLV